MTENITPPMPTSPIVPGATLPAISLIICTRNRARLLGELVQSILVGDELPSEIIVIDDSDVPHADLGSMAGPPGCQIRYHWAHSAGLSRANNDGIALALHDLLVFTQDDVLVTRTWFGTLARSQIAAGADCVITGRVLPGPPEEAGAFAPSTISDDEPRSYAGRIGVDILYVQNMALYRATADAVGGFDARLGPGTPYPGAEDNDFAFRLLEAGYRILYEPLAVTYHRAWRPPAAHTPLCWNYGRGQGGYYGKHLRLADRYMLNRLLADLKRQGRLTFRRIRQPGRALGHVATLLGLVYGVLRWQVVDRRRQLWSS
jgi:glycosyltransferase involved in cell wall biosynthesis